MKNVVFPFRVFPALDPVLGPEMQSTGESMGSGPTFAVAYWKAWLGAGLRGLPFGRTVYVSAPDVPATQIDALISCLQNTGITPILSPDTPASQASVERIPPADLDVPSLALVIVLGRTRSEIGVLRRAADTGVGAVSTHGGLRALQRALDEGVPDLSLSTPREPGLETPVSMVE